MKIYDLKIVTSSFSVEIQFLMSHALWVAGFLLLAIVLLLVMVLKLVKQIEQLSSENLSLTEKNADLESEVIVTIEDRLSLLESVVNRKAD